MYHTGRSQQGRCCVRSGGQLPAQPVAPLIGHVANPGSRAPLTGAPCDTALKGLSAVLLFFAATKLDTPSAWRAWSSSAGPATSTLGGWDGRSRAPASPIPSATPSPIPSATPSAAASSASSPRQSDPTTRLQGGAEFPSPVPTDPPSLTSSPGLDMISSSVDDQDRNAETSYAARVESGAPSCPTPSTRPPTPSTATSSPPPRTLRSLSPISTPEVTRSKALTPLTPLTLFTPLTSEPVSENVSQKGVESVSGVSGVNPLEEVQTPHVTALTSSTPSTPEQVRSTSPSPSSSPSPSPSPSPAVITCEPASGKVSEKGVESVSGVSGVRPFEKVQAPQAMCRVTSTTEQVRSPSLSPTAVRSPSPSPPPSSSLVTFRSEPATANVSQTGVKSVSGVSGVTGLVCVTSAVETEELQSPGPPESPRYVRPPSPRYVPPPYVAGVGDVGDEHHRLRGSWAERRGMKGLKS